MMLYTKVLTDKHFLYAQYKGWKLKRKLKKYKISLENIISEAIENKDFIIKFDELYELYILIENYNSTDSYFRIIENKNSPILSFKLQLDDIFDLRIDLDPKYRDFRVRCEEIQIEYCMDYTFHNSIKYTDYNDDCKEKDKQLMQYINDTLYNAYLGYLKYVLDVKTPNKNKIGCENIDEPYIDTEELD